MTKLFSVTAVLMVIGAQQAQAQACPERITPQVERTLGTEIAWLRDEVRAHRPVNMRLLGRPVPYVVVERDWKLQGDPRTWPIETLRFRLEGVGRRSGEYLPTPVRGAFDRAYRGEDCASGTAFTCSELYPEMGDEFGDLQSVELTADSVSVPDDARGEGLPQLRADDGESDLTPGFLVCTYETMSDDY